MRIERTHAKLGTPMSVISSRPGGAFKMRGAALTTAETVAESPATPVLMVIFRAGSPSIWQLSCGLGASRYIFKSRVMTIFPATITSPR